MRLLLTKRGCPYCNEAIKVINKINLKLQVGRKIQIVDLYSWEEFGLDNNPLRELFNRSNFDGYPFLYIEGILIEPAPTRENLKILVSSFLGDELN